jgi:hypothetical protein
MVDIRVGMQPKDIWRLYCLMAIFAIGMTVSLVIFLITNLDVLQWVGIGFMLAGVVVLVVLLFKLKKMFTGDNTSEKTWRSYR